jgi:hypothetical protein
MAAVHPGALATGALQKERKNTELQVGVKMSFMVSKQHSCTAVDMISVSDVLSTGCRLFWYFSAVVGSGDNTQQRA